MSVAKNQKQAKTSPRKKTPQEALPWDETKQDGTDYAWTDVGEEVLINVIEVVCGSGNSLQFTVSRDGGQLGIRVYDHELATKTVWASGNGDMDRVLENIIAHYTSRTQSGGSK